MFQSRRGNLILTLVIASLIVLLMIYRNDGSSREVPVVTKQSDEASGHIDQVHDTATAEAPETRNQIAQSEPISDSDSGDVQQMQSSMEAYYHPIFDELEINKDNELVEKIYDDDGVLVMEIDNDPASFSFKKTLKTFHYKGNKFTKVIKYQYYTDQLVETHIDIAYNKDGTVYDTRELIHTTSLVSNN